MVKNILFDLDGTITDSGVGIINSMVYAIEKLALPKPDIETLRSFIGPPLIDTFLKLTNDSKQAQLGVDYYREYYKEKGLFENQLYPDIADVLEQLQQAGNHLYIATSKPEKFAKQILDYFQLTNHFKGIYGASMDSRRSKKSDVINYALKKAQINPAIESTVMIGDRDHDILGAKENHLKSIGVLYGFGDFAELSKAKADSIVSSPMELLSTLL